MQSLQYHLPASVNDAVKLIKQHADHRLLAGGQTVLPSSRLGLLETSGWIDLGGIAELKGVREAADTLVIGSMTAHEAVAESPLVRKRIPALADLARGIGDPQVRNRGTLGGSLANSDPAACYPAAVLGLAATIQTDKRTIPADGFFKGLYETALDTGEIITAITFPVPEKAAYVKFKQAASRFALVGVFVAKTRSGVRVAVTGAGSHVFRATPLEAKLDKKFAPESCDGVVLPADGLNNDIHASAEYRAHLITVLTRRAVAAAR
jgi:carbon-monoxide dehydrogenase medium subunit